MPHFNKCISNIKNVLIDNAEDLGVVMPMYNLIGYTKYYSVIFGTFWNCTGDISADPKTNSESFKCKTSIAGKTVNDGHTKEVQFSVPRKHLSNFWKLMPLINCEDFEVCNNWWNNTIRWP